MKSFSSTYFYLNMELKIQINFNKNLKEDKMKLRDPLMGIKMGQGHIVMHLVFFIIINFYVIPQNVGKCLTSPLASSLPAAT